MRKCVLSQSPGRGVERRERGRNLSPSPGECLAPLASQDSVCALSQRFEDPHSRQDFLSRAAPLCPPPPPSSRAPFPSGLGWARWPQLLGSGGVLEPTGPRGGHWVMRVPHIVYTLWLCVCHTRCGACTCAQGEPAVPCAMSSPQSLRVSLSSTLPYTEVFGEDQAGALGVKLRFPLCWATV